VKFLFHTHLALDFPDRISEIAEVYQEHEFVIVSGKAQLYEEIPESDVLVDHRIDEELLDAATKLKWMFVPFTGLNSIPWKLLAERNIRVSNNHGNADIVAERAFSLALAVMGRIPEFDRGLRRGYWHRNDSREEPFVFWTSLRGKRVSILGTGAIGCRIAELSSAFTDRITGFRRRAAEVNFGKFSQVTTKLSEALEKCDVCFITLPLTPSTEGLIGAAELKMLEGGYLVNVSRGEIVQEKPLFDVLTGGRLRGAGLDAWYQYPEQFHSRRLPSNLAFHELENVVLSPHAGSHAPEGKLGQLEGTLRNIRSLIDSGFPLDIADPAAGY
jgi:phosphoglycerate dehydrogenase-like enzyme